MGRKKQWMGVVMKIQVTQEDIDKGIKQNICNCPIALSLKRNFPRAKVGCSITLNGTWNDAIDTPVEASCFIDKFDNDLPVEPFEFDLPD
mgnify:CR=1 FL=1